MSTFDRLCNLVIERAESHLTEAQNTVYYGLNPEFDSSKLTGFDQLVANFLETKPATADEIVDVVQRNSEDPDNRNGAIEALRNLIDGKVIIPTTAPTAGGTEETEGEPDAAALQQEPEVDVTAPVVPPQAEEEDDEEQGSTTAGAVPPPEEDEADTFEPPTVAKNNIQDIAPPADELDDELGDENDDTPTSELVKRENAKSARKQQQMSNLVRYIYQKRGKTPEEAEAHLQQLRASGKL